jgi:hypothetical protein
MPLIMLLNMLLLFHMHFNMLLLFSMNFNVMHFHMHLQLLAQARGLILPLASRPHRRLPLLREHSLAHAA